jgi:hypothetical protein
MKYCSDECCRIATNQKLKEAYYEKKARLSGVVFKCKSRGCNNELSRYSTEKTCSTCKAKEKTKEKNVILNMLKESGM